MNIFVNIWNYVGDVGATTFDQLGNVGTTAWTGIVEFTKTVLMLG